MTTMRTRSTTCGALAAPALARRRTSIAWAWRTEVHLPGTACNDSNANTINDVWSANCTCAGTPSTSIAWAWRTDPPLPGTACNDGNANTINDVWSANCTCAGTPINFDCAGRERTDRHCRAPRATTATPHTGNDTWNANCQCVGQIDRLPRRGRWHRHCPAPRATTTTRTRSTMCGARTAPALARLSPSIASVWRRNVPCPEPTCDDDNATHRQRHVERQLPVRRTARSIAWA